ncbi:MAG: o-succinylbenzoate synthase [Ignavibacteriaceae bacterium]
MKLKEFSVTPFSLTFRKPFHTSKAILKERKGFILSLSDLEGFKGEGEISPLAGFSIENLIDAEKQLFEIANTILMNEIPEEKNELEKFTNGFNLHSSVKCGIEQAIISLILKRNKIQLKDFFKRIPRESIPVNAVIGMLPVNAVLEKIKLLINDGFTTIKLKLGRNNFNADLNLCSHVRSTFGGAIQLRGDCNGAWNFDQAKKYLPQLTQFNFAYIEQPTLNVNDFSVLKNLSQIPIAADESIDSIATARSIIQNKLADVLIIKPMHIGGVFSSLKIMDLAEQSKLKIIFTSLFESPVGKRLPILLSSLLREPLPCGLATDGFFVSYLSAYPIINGHIHLQNFSL